MEIDPGAAYSARAEEYAELFGSMSAIHPADRALIDAWADSLTGHVIDAGCGPGHWTSYLAGRGAAVTGVDVSEALIAHARRTHPGITFALGSFDELSNATGSVGGVLSWYSLIHHEPSAIQVPLAEFARVLSPGAGLLVGFFEGPTIEKFDHAVLDAHRWPVAAFAQQLHAAGFDVQETHSRAGPFPRPRPHGAIVARRR